MKLQHQFRIITQTATSTLTQLPYRNYAIELSLTGQQPTLYLYLIRQLLLLRLCMCVYICLYKCVYICLLTGSIIDPFLNLSRVNDELTVDRLVSWFIAG